MPSPAVSRRGRCATRIAFIGFVSLAAAVCWVTPRMVDAREIGVVFDDSGSMAGFANFPAFGFQQLAATLTGRDRLRVVRFRRFLDQHGRNIGPWGADSIGRSANIAAIDAIDVDEAAQRAAALEEIAGWGQIKAGVGTPFGALELMLWQTLEAAKASDEAAFLIVLTDGEFNNLDTDARRRRARQLIQGYRERYPEVDLTLYFLGFARTPETAQKIREQGVAEALVETFPRNQRSKQVIVQSFDDLSRQLRDIIAVVNESDIGEESATVAKSGNIVTITPPLSVSRIILIDSAPSPDRPATIAQVDGVGAKVFRQAPAMLSADKYPWLGGDAIWRGVVSIVQPPIAIEPGKQVTLTLDGQRAAQSIVLFESEIAINWQVIDAKTGVEVEPRNGELLLAKDYDYIVRASISGRNSAGGQSSRLTFKHLPEDAEFRLDAGLLGARNLDIRRSEDQAVAEYLRFTEEGAADMAVTLRMPGFIIKSSERFRIRVRDVAANVNLEWTPGPDCPTCDDGRLDREMVPNAPATHLATINAHVKTEAAVSGRLKMSLSKALPTGIELRDAQGAVLAQAGALDFDLPFEAGQSPRIELWATAKAADPQGAAPFDLAAEAERPLIGADRLRVFPELAYTEAKITLIGVSNDRQAPASAPLNLETTDLAGNQDGVLFRVEGLKSPQAAKDARPFLKFGAIDRLDFMLTPEADGANVFRLAPSYAFPTSWFTWACCAPSGDYDVPIRYDDLEGQTGSAVASVQIARPPFWLRGALICLIPILTLAAAVWLLMAAFRLATMVRFPRRSRLLIYPEGGRLIDAQKLPLRRGGLIYLQALAWPWRAHDERRSVQGLRLMATSDGAMMLPGSYDTFYRPPDPRPLSHLFPAGDKEARIELFWNDRLTRRVGREAESIVLAADTTS